jgi:hypothetical protein
LQIVSPAVTADSGGLRGQNPRVGLPSPDRRGPFRGPPEQGCLASFELPADCRSTSIVVG